MLSNLANVYAALKHLHNENLVTLYGAAPTYLSKIAGKEVGKIIFLYEEDRNKARAQSFVSPSKLNTKKQLPIKTEDDLNLTGSPLKDDCIVDTIDDISLHNFPLMPWRFEEECHKGISVDKARNILCRQEFQNSGSSDAKGSVWILCNGADLGNTLLLQFEFAEGPFSRGVVTYLGVMPAYAVNTQSLLQQHLAVMPPDIRVETSIENVYRIKAHITLRCSWTAAGALPSLSELNSFCDVVLFQTYCVSDCGSLTQDFLNQLRMLMLIRDDILAYKQAELNNPGREAVYRCGRGIDMEELRENIYDAMTEISGLDKVDISNELESDLESVVQRAQFRGLSDLSDKLWEILKRCASYKDLKASFYILFQCAIRCNIVNTPTNKNRLSEIITELANKRLAIPCLTGSEPLELLLEIGLEKLYKDYEFFFVQSKICSVNSLKLERRSKADEENDENVIPNVRKSLHGAIRADATSHATSRKTFLHNKSTSKSGNVNDVVGFKNSNFCETETAASLARLWQIHCTLEHLLMIHIHLNLRSGVYGYVCEQLLKKPQRPIQSINESVKDEIEVPISAHDVREHLEGKNPYSRRISMKSKNKFREVNSTFYYSMENIMPPTISENLPSESFTAEKDEITYHGWLYRKIKTLK